MSKKKQSIILYVVVGSSEIVSDAVSLNVFPFHCLQYIELRYNTSTLRKLSTFCHLITKLFYMGICLYAPSLALSTVTGLSTWSSMLTMGFICTFYITIVSDIKSGVEGWDFGRDLISWYVAVTQWLTWTNYICNAIFETIFISAISFKVWLIMRRENCDFY